MRLQRTKSDNSGWRKHRSLRLEFLERRDLLTAVRLVSWNTENQPNGPSDDANYQTILQAIGNETVLGNTRPVDILALQETDPAAGGNSIGRIESILDTLYVDDYASVLTTEDGGGDSTGFVYNTATVTLLESVEVDPGTHNVMRGLFRPVDTTGESDFYVYSVHLTSSGGPAGRATEAQALRNDADLLGEGTSVLMVGDFNLEGSSEAAYANLTAVGAAQQQDVAGAPGEWSDNISFRSLHSQDPGASMDDRFDLHFASGELFDDVGIDYIDGSYRVFGNNGTHTLGSPITTGSGAAPAVLSALAAASDHLPVIADYDVIFSTPNVRVRETGDQTKAIEGGDFDVYSVVLDTVPTNTVTVTVTPDAQVDLGAGAGVSTQLVFTPSNALTPQTIIVTANDDAAGEGDHAGLISHTSTSLDLDYDGLTIDDVSVDLVDDDAPEILINELDADTPSMDTMEFVELYDGGVGNSSLDGLTLVVFNGNDDLADETFDLTGFSTDADGFFVLGNVGVTSADITFPSNVLENGADAVALYSGSFSTGAIVTTANLLDAIVYDTGQADDLGLLTLLQAAQPQVNEDENGNKVIESLSRVPDGGNARETDTYVAQTPTPAALNAPPAPGVTITQSGARVDVAEGGTTDSYLIALDTFPTHDVMITVDPDDQTDLGAGAGVAVVLTFTPTNAIIPQTINVLAVEDADVEQAHTSTITHAASSTDTGYNGIVVGNVVANIVDNEIFIPPRLVISEIMYDPASDETAPGIAEWIEVVNTGGSTADLEGWFFDDEDGGSWGPIPAGTLLAPGQIAVFFDEVFTTEAQFRIDWAVPANALVVGIDWAGLANGPSDTNEILELFNTQAVQQDLVNYDDAFGWPSNTNGPSIYLTDLQSDNNVGGNWARSQVGVQNAKNPTGIDFSSSDVGSPGYIPSGSADFNFSGVVDALDFLAWQRGAGTSAPNALRTDGDGDSDLDVDGADLTLWETQYNGGSIVAAIVVEEGLSVEDAPVIVASSLAPVENASLASVVLPLAADISGSETSPADSVQPLAALAREVSLFAGNEGTVFFFLPEPAEANLGDRLRCPDSWLEGDLQINGEIAASDTEQFSEGLRMGAWSELLTEAEGSDEAAADEALAALNGFERFNWRKPLS